MEDDAQTVCGRCPLIASSLQIIWENEKPRLKVEQRSKFDAELQGLQAVHRRHMELRPQLLRAKSSTDSFHEGAQEHDIKEAFEVSASCIRGIGSGSGVHRGRGREYLVFTTLTADRGGDS